LYAPAAEIQAYLERVAKKFSADRFIKLQHEIKGCAWDDKLAKWNVEVQNLATGETFKDQADVLISARGNLNTPSWPDIDGLETFQGEVMHSATWKEELVAKDFLCLVDLSSDQSIVMISRTSALV
jgi:cation diffusion facilitator CzcD-associated flavoprotein CzcO